MSTFRYSLLSFIMLFVTNLFSQETIKVSGNIYDTLNKKGVENVVIMGIRIKDSILQDFGRSNFSGEFSIDVPKDTIQVLFTHPSFEEREYYIFGNGESKDMNFGRIILPQKGEELKEFVLVSNNSPIYFKGDTLVMVADSFKTDANANVEDLFKKLPGFDVDNSGKIVVHGKEVNKVYVDGDEFFGTDPTVATKNLPANAIENVQIYDQKVEGDNTEETEKVINLTLKEDAKKGYFGKINGASDFTNFYEGEVLLNRFKGSQKISVFGLFTNTPRSGFNWQDRYKYGITEEIGSRNEDGGYDFEPQIGNLGTGVPQKSKAGFYFTDKLGKKLELGANFTYDNQNLITESETNSQFILTDTTYSSFQKDSAYKTQEALALNFDLTWIVDSNSTFSIQPRFRQINGTTEELTLANFISEEGQNTRTTENLYSERTFFDEASVTASWVTEFDKSGRKLEINYQFKNQSNSSKDFLTNTDLDNLNGLTLSSLNQSKNGKAKNQRNLGEFGYIEPLGKKFKLEGKYLFSSNIGSNEKFAFDNNGEGYNEFNEQFSSDFEINTFSQRLGGRLIYKSSKHEVAGGVDYNIVNFSSNDLLLDSGFNRNQSNVLPYFSYKYKFSRSETITLKYKSSVLNPDMGQLQPLPDNRDLNNIRLGNNNLVSQVSQDVSINYFTYKATTGSHTYANVSFKVFENAFSQGIFYDDKGRSLVQTINVSGNNTLNAYAGTSIPLFKQKIKFNPFVNLANNNYNSEINNIANLTNNKSLFTRGTIKYVSDSLELSIGGNYNYSLATTSLNPINQVNTTYAVTGGIMVMLPGKVVIKSNLSFNNTIGRAEGFDVTYTLWDASVSRLFLRKENLEISVDAKDLLNQNISNSRNVYDNIIVDDKTNIIGRYILLRAVYKFNVLNKAKDEGDLLSE